MATGSEQPLPPSPPAPAPYTYPPVIIILTIVLLIFFFVGFFSIYFCRCFMQNLLCTWYQRNAPTAPPVGGGATTAATTNGVDPSIVQSFPSFTYSTVKDYRKEKYGLECAICLLEFKGSDVLRLLTKCCHVFHQECIDLWLESHKTCPVCRRNLTTPGLQSPVKSPVHEISIDDDLEDHTFTSITIKDDNENVSKKGEGVSSCDHHSDDEQTELEKFPRSHSTGHSILRNRDNVEKEDRFTLRLPEHVKSRIMKGHCSSKSWSTFGEYKEKDDAMNLAELTGESGGDDKV